MLPLRTKIRQDEPEVDPVMVKEPLEATDDDEPSVSTRSWTRSQDPPPALAGTSTLSKCALNANLIDDPDELQQGLSARVSSIWEELQMSLY